MIKPMIKNNNAVFIKKTLTVILVGVFLFTSTFGWAMEERLFSTVIENKSFSARPADNNKLAPESRLNSEEFKTSLAVAAICKHIEHDGNLDDKSYLNDVLARLDAEKNSNITVLPYEIIIEIPNEGLAIRYFDPTKANVITPYSDISKLSTKVIGPRLNRQIIHRIKALRVPLYSISSKELSNPLIVINGGRPLVGKVHIGGSKHAVTVLMGALLLSAGQVTFDNFPDITDAQEMLAIYESMGVKVDRSNDKVNVSVKPRELSFSSQQIWRTKNLRASILLLGSALLRLKSIEFPSPGGDQLNRDFHKCFEILDDFGIQHNSFEAPILRAWISKPLEGDRIVNAEIASGSGKGYSGNYNTALAMILAAGNKGRTTINNAVVTSEIEELGNFLRRIGVKIFGIGTSQIIIESQGIEALENADIVHEIQSDKVEIVFWIVAAMMTKGCIDIVIDNYYGKLSLDSLGPLRDYYKKILEPIGIYIQQIDDNTIRVDYAKSNLKNVDVRLCYKEDANIVDPALHLFPLLCLVPGQSTFVDERFGNLRLRGRTQLVSMGAQIIDSKEGVAINGVDRLQGNALLKGEDIRDAANLLLAALSAQGISRLDGYRHINRSYANLIDKLDALGARVYLEDSAQQMKDQANFIDRNERLFKDMLGENKPDTLVRVPVEAIESVGRDNIKDFLATFQEAPNGYVELYYMSGIGEASEAVYQKYGLQKKPLPKDFRRTRENTVTLFPALKGEEIDQSTIVSRLGSLDITPENTILSPIGLQHDPAGLIRATILGLKMIDIARQIKEKGSGITKDQAFKDKIQLEILEQLKIVCDADDLKNFNLTPDDIIALATGTINNIITALKKLIKLLPITPIDAEELRQIYEHAKEVITAA